ncbi:MAG: MBL fold metallo-hydrolase [Edaphobacter sp.]|uniref:MBL fold metallo-hydrolase n=1 Tax=Edaphobacter sp. TaxID=1934404 RepID=UPI00239925D0|nr:MBL fold metallo-hydrolase [Edaphobacter sp.]MDE1178746.1 MBL fold metallo-hydrolase [Edaphobacter sp.]
MKIERFEIAGLAQYSYIVSDAGEAVVIDPIRDIDRYTDYLAAHSLRLTSILETHIHADFATGSVELAAATGAKLALSAYDAGERFVYAMPHRQLFDGDSIPVAQARLVARHTPGHTPEHLSFLLYEDDAATQPSAIFSGDFLFAGSLGRPDLLGEEAKLGLARELYRSATERIADLPDTLAIYPGHGAGSLCGSGMSERAETTLGFEREHDPYLRYPRQEFLEKILASVPEMPAYYPRMKQLNADGAPVIGDRLTPQWLSPSEVASIKDDDATVLIDLRGTAAFAAGHIAGSINIGRGPSLSLWAGWLLDAAKKIVLIVERRGDEVEESLRGLLRVGLDDILGVATIAEWRDAGYALTAMKLRNAADVQRELPSLYLLDVRNQGERSSGIIAGAHPTVLGDLTQHLDEIPREAKIVTICASGYRASIAASLLAAAGYADVSMLDGGMSAWQDLHAAQ